MPQRPRSRLSPVSKAMGWVGRPHVVVLLVGGVVGLVMVLVVPALAGIDEPYHYLRAWSISDGDLVPDKGDLPGGVRGGGTCVPATITRQLFDIRRPYLEHLIPNYDGSDPLKATKACPENVGERVVFVDMATFAWYTPMSYAPQVFAVAIGRLTGAGVSTQLVLARLASLAAYLALCAWAVALAPRAKWALVAIALLPVSMFQAATSLSPDGLTLAAVLLLIATALRACDAELALPRARVLFCYRRKFRSSRSIPIGRAPR